MATVYRLGPLDDPDRYQLTELRSRGGEGELWVGWVTAQGQQLPVAVKLFHPIAGIPIADLYERVRGQAEILRSLDHPNLVKVREAFVGPALHEPGQADPSTAVLCLAMNWVPGENLESWVARNPDRDPLECTRIITRVAAAVDELHSGRSTNGTPVLHRDIKPANVIVEGESVRLVDFGLARFASSNFTTIAGSPAYIAPEVVAGAPPTEASDRFGLGATAYFLFTGEPPNLNSPSEMRGKLHQVRGIPDVDGFSRHVLAMLDRDPARRPTNVIEWAQGLALGTVSQSFAPPAAPPPRRRGRKALIGAAVALLLVVAGAVGALALLGGDGDSDDDAAAADTVAPSSSTSTTRRPTTSTSSTSSTSTSSTSSTSLPDSPGAIAAPDSIQYLADFEAVDADVWRADYGQGSLSGTNYTRTVMVDANRDSTAFLEFDLGRKYARLDGLVGLRDDVPAGTTMKIEIYGDGNVLFDQTVGLGDAMPFDIDVTNVLRLRLQIADLTGEYPYDVFAIFADPKLTPA